MKPDKNGRRAYKEGYQAGINGEPFENRYTKMGARLAGLASWYQTGYDNGVKGVDCKTSMLYNKQHEH